MASNGEQQHTPTPWALRSSGLFVGNLDGNLCFVARLEHTDEQGWADGAFMLRAVNSHDEMVQQLTFAVANGSKWDLNDWQNWITNHAQPALALAEKES